MITSLDFSAPRYLVRCEKGLYTHSNSKCLKTLFAGMAICLSLRGLCSAKDIPVPRFLGIFEVEPV